MLKGFYYYYYYFLFGGLDSFSWRVMHHVGISLNVNLMLISALLYFMHLAGICFMIFLIIFLFSS
jgi:hypothetical protein